MSENDFQSIKENGINLALDPNLINLPLYNSSFSPNSKPTNSIEAETIGDDINADSNITVDHKKPLLEIDNSKLISNPYEIFGQMPLDQLIPLITQQKGAGFTFANLLEDELIREIQQEDGKDRNINDEANDNELYNEFENDKIDMDILPTEHSITEESNFQYKQEDNVSSLEPMNSQINEFVEKETFQSGSNLSDDTITQAKFEQVRKEMIDNINLAMNESSLALEFVSLLLSGAREQSALSSMSPFLKKTVSPGSLNSEKIPLEEKSEKDKQLLAILDKGWKLKSLDDSRQMLKDNYVTLSKTLEREHEYWKKVSTNINNKDVVFKLRDNSTNQRVLGIKYGYGDSGSTYRHDKGIALLRNNTELTKLELVPTSVGNSEFGSDSQNYERFIKIRIYTRLESEDDAVLSGESSLSNLFLESTNNESEKASDNIRAQITRLKAFIFEKELMYHLKKECSKLISFGVVVENENKIIVELSNERFEIEFLHLQDSSVVNHDQDAPKVNDKRANLILITLRMLLVVMFKKEIKQKMISSKRTVSRNADDILLIKPILGKIRHHGYKLLLMRILKDYVLGVVPGSSMEEKKPESSVDEDLSENHAVDKHIKQLTNEIKAFDHLLDLPISRFTVTLPMKDNKISKIELILENPNHCNAIVGIKYIDKNNTRIFDTKFTEFKEIEEFLSFIVGEHAKDKAALSSIDAEVVEVN